MHRRTPRPALLLHSDTRLPMVPQQRQGQRPHPTRDRAWRDRRGEMLFVDARKLGAMVDRTHRELAEQEIRRIAGTYHAWRGEPANETYEDVPGFCASAKLKQIADHRFILTPGRYVGSEEADEDDEPLGDKIVRLTHQLYEAFDDSDRLQDELRRHLGRLTSE